MTMLPWKSGTAASRLRSFTASDSPPVTKPATTSSNTSRSIKIADACTQAWAISARRGSNRSTQKVLNRLSEIQGEQISLVAYGVIWVHMDCGDLSSSAQCRLVRRPNSQKVLVGTCNDLIGLKLYDWMSGLMAGRAAVEALINIIRKE